MISAPLCTIKKTRVRYQYERGEHRRKHCWMRDCAQLESWLDEHSQPVGNGIMILGQPDKLQIEIRPSEQGKHLGVGSLRVSLGKPQIWCNEAGGGIDWTWIELLEQLGGQ